MARFRKLSADRSTPPRQHDIEPVAPFPDHVGDQLRRVLQIRVNRNDGVAGGNVDAGGERGFLAEVPGQFDDDQTVVPLAASGQCLQGSVRTAVVDANDLQGAVQRRPQLREPLEQGVQPGRLIVHWNNQRNGLIGPRHDVLPPQKPDFLIFDDARGRAAAQERTRARAGLRWLGD